MGTGRAQSHEPRLNLTSQQIHDRRPRSLVADVDQVEVVACCKKLANQLGVSSQAWGAPAEPFGRSVDVGNEALDVLDRQVCIDHQRRGRPAKQCQVREVFHGIHAIGQLQWRNDV